MEELILSVPDIMPTLLGLAGLEERIPAEVQGKNYARILKDPEADQPARPTSALFINPKSRGIYTGKYMFVMTEEGGTPAEIFCYDNEKDPYQLNRIPMENMERETAEELIRELAVLLRNTNDKWYQERICSDIIPY